MTINMKTTLAALLLASLAAGAQAQATRMMMPEGTYDLYFGLAYGTTFHQARDGGNTSVVVPALSAQWSNGVFADINTQGAALGYYLSDNPMLDYGVELSMSERDQRPDTPGERGGAAVQAGGFVNWHVLYNVGVSAELLAGGGFDRGGVLASARIHYSTPLTTHIGATLAAGLALADHSWMQGYFGVTPAQAASGGNRVYRAPAGLLNSYADLELQWQLGNKYWLNTGVRLSTLAGAAAASPLVRDRNRYSLRTELTYHF